MIGQMNNKNNIAKWIQNNSFPRFIIINGSEGSGRLTLAKHIAKSLDIPASISGKSIEEVREVITYAYSVTTPAVYIFPNANEMSVAALNAMLKVVEDPPNNSYFIMTCTGFELLGTLRSRATSIQIEPYSRAELLALTDDALKLQYCDTPGMIKYWEDKNFEEFIQFCETVRDNIFEVSGVNALKIPSRLKFKEEDEGFPPDQFARVLIKMWSDKALPYQTWRRLIMCTNTLLTRLNSKSIKKEFAVDSWLLQIKEYIE